MFGTNVTEIDGFTTLGFDTNEKVIAMLIQNMLHAKNADRRAAISSGTYLDPFEGTNANTILQRLFVQLVNGNMLSDITYS
jgi:hypothetical protein